MSTIDTHRLRATVTLPGGTNYPLEVIDARITLDEGWSPYVQVDLTCALPPSAIVEQLDPRQGLRAWVSAQQDFGRGVLARDVTAALDADHASDVTARFGGKLARDFTLAFHTPYNAFGLRSPSLFDADLSVRTRKLDPRAGTMTLELSSDESLLQDYALVSNEPQAPIGGSVRDAVSFVLSKIGAVLADDDADADVEDAESLTMQPGTTGWDYVEPLVQKGNLRLYCTERRVWRLVPAVSSIDGLLTLSADNNVTDATDTVSLDGEWFDAVVIVYAWRDETGATHVAYDTAGPARPRKVRTIEHATSYPGPGAASAVLARKEAQGRVQTVSAVADYDTRPGKAVSITLPDTPTQTGFVSSVSWRFPDYSMDVKSRGLLETPDSAWMFLTAGNRWQDSPVGGTWANEPIGA